MPIIEYEKLTEYLNDFGCDENEKSDILYCNGSDDVHGMIILLQKHRKHTLNSIHKEEKQISCLDYLVFQLEKEMQTQK